jgi:hypothetical protein
VDRHDPSERLWNALKRLAQGETGCVTEGQAIKRVKAIAKKEGALDLPERALRFYAGEYREMVNRRVTQRS